MNTMNPFTQKFVGAALALTTAVGLQGCTDQEVATALGAVAIGAGAVAIGVAAGSDDRDHHHGRRRGRRVCDGGYVTRCTTYRDYWGYERRECRSEWDSCRYTRWEPYAASELAALDLVDGDISEFLASDIQVMASAPAQKTKLENTAVEAGKWAQTFKLSFDSAEFFTRSLEKARAGDMKALLDLGLAREDVRDMAREKMPSDDAIELLARKLNQRPENTRAMLKTLLVEGGKIKKSECKKRIRQSPRSPLAMNCR